MPANSSFSFSIFFFLSTALFGQALPVTGQPAPGLESIDEAMQNLLTKYRIPGGALAVTSGGKLVFARGYGYSDTASATPVKPDSLFRMASVSKTFTAIAILKLVEQGKLQLDQPAFALLPDLTPAPHATLNPNLARITIRELLNHTGGWDRAIVPDAMDRTLQEAQAAGAGSPATCDTAIRFMLGQPLQHVPGAVYAYSNFGYCVLGAVIQRVGGMSYERYVRQNVLTPLGIQRAKIADSLLSDVVNGEATYYDAPGAPPVTNLYDPAGPPVPAPYGGHNFEAAFAAGGWVTTPIELLRFINGIEGRRGGPLLQPATIREMQTKAPAFTGTNFYGLGFNMSPSVNGFIWTKDGGLPGTASYVYRQANGLCWAVVFNSRPVSTGTTDGDSADAFETDFVTTLRILITAAQAWPALDQFPAYASTLVQPLIAASNGVLQGATFLAGIVSGSWVSIKGANLGTATRIWRANDFNGAALPLEMDRVSVTVNGKPAPIYYVSPTQLNVQAPADTATGSVDVTVTHDGQTSNIVQGRLVVEAPGFFTYASGRFVAAVHQDGSVVGDPTVVPGTRAASPGEIIELYGTGFGASPAGQVIASPIVLQPAPAVTIGGLPAAVQFAGLVGVGLYQINVVVPQVAAGPQAATITFNGAASPAGPAIVVGR
ncbi:MAG: serine hydrolase [Acidobacteriota bacterium]|nr:serine hydrolase [Acidobacteriota bacterium]